MAQVNFPVTPAPGPGTANAAMFGPVEQLAKGIPDIVALRNLQSTQAIGRAMQAATGPNGQINYLTAQRLAAQNPAAALGMAHMSTVDAQNRQMDAQRHAQLAAHEGEALNILSQEVAAGKITTMQAKSMIVNYTDALQMPKSMQAQMLGQIPSDRDGFVKYVSAMGRSAISASDAAATTPHIMPVQQGNQVNLLGINPATGTVTNAGNGSIEPVQSPTRVLDSQGNPVVTYTPRLPTSGSGLLSPGNGAPPLEGTPGNSLFAGVNSGYGGVPSGTPANSMPIVRTPLPAPTAPTAPPAPTPTAPQGATPPVAPTYTPVTGSMPDAARQQALVQNAAVLMRTLPPSVMTPTSPYQTGIPQVDELKLKQAQEWVQATTTNGPALQQEASNIDAIRKELSGMYSGTAANQRSTAASILNLLGVPSSGVVNSQEFTKSLAGFTVNTAIDKGFGTASDFRAGIVADSLPKMSNTQEANSFVVNMLSGTNTASRILQSYVANLQSSGQLKPDQIYSAGQAFARNLSPMALALTQMNPTQQQSFMADLKKTSPQAARVLAIQYQQTAHEVVQAISRGFVSSSVSPWSLK